uniref:Uncharacterized protein n=1 Tax=Siphoviridae sp. ctYh54 TaxID=2826379 RepID=A0A8S5MEE3_9CAUD|nr:MAG TPA: hypothetical protein [Siphoviridae sp. ctYh54]
MLKNMLYKSFHPLQRLDGSSQEFLRGTLV